MDLSNSAVWQNYNADLLSQAREQCHQNWERARHNKGVMERIFERNSHLPSYHLENLIANTIKSQYSPLVFEKIEKAYESKGCITILALLCLGSIALFFIYTYAWPPVDYTSYCVSNYVFKPLWSGSALVFLIAAIYKAVRSYEHRQEIEDDQKNPILVDGHPTPSYRLFNALTRQYRPPSLLTLITPPAQQN